VTRAVIPWRDHLESLNLLLSAIAIDFPSLCLTVSNPSMVQRKSKGDDFLVLDDKWKRRSTGLGNIDCCRLPSI